MSFADKARKIIAEMKKDDGEKREIEPIRPLPYLDLDGSLVVPFGSDARYHWWDAGQLPSETEREVKGWKH